MKYATLFNSDALILRDSSGNNIPFNYVGQVSDSDAIQALQTDVQSRGSVTAGALSLMLTIFDHPRMDGYKGTTPIGDRMTKEIKGAIREREEYVLKPLFFGYLDAKNPDDAKAAETDVKHPYIGARAIQWDLFIGALREGGVYGNVKSYTMQYFAYFGKLPCVYDGDNPDKTRMLSVAAMAKLIANAKTDKVKPADMGFAGELADIAKRLKERGEKAVIGDNATALHALRELLAFFEGRTETAAVKATEALAGGTAPDVAKMAEAATRQAKTNSRSKSRNKDAAAIPAV